MVMLIRIFLHLSFVSHNSQCKISQQTVIMLIAFDIAVEYDDFILSSSNRTSELLTSSTYLSRSLKRTVNDNDKLKTKRP